MTDSEIIKALEENKDEILSIIGNGIVYFEDVLSLITRQKAEIESLRDLNKQLETDNFNANMNLESLVDQIYEIRKAEAEVKFLKKRIQSESRREFAERLKNQLEDLEYTANINRKTVPVGTLLTQVNWVLHSVMPETIDSLLKEMESESE